MNRLSLSILVLALKTKHLLYVNLIEKILNIENRVKQLRLGHVHTIYNKCPAYLRDNLRKTDRLIT